MDVQWQYAASPINWCNDDLMDLGDDYTVADILSDMHALGLSGTELGRKYPRSPTALRPLLESYGLRLVSGWAQIHLADPAWRKEELAHYARHVNFLKNMGCAVVVTAEGSGSVHWDREGDRPRKIPWTPEEWRHVQEGLEEAGALCQNAGMTLVYHPHLGTNIEGQEDIERLLDNTAPDRVSLVLDTGHLYAAGVDPSWVLQQYPERVRHVHMKSVRPPVLARYQAGLSFLEAVRQGLFTVPGDGVIDFVPTLQSLSRIGYTGWCVIEAEQDPVQADPVDYMHTALAYLSTSAQTLSTT